VKVLVATTATQGQRPNDVCAASQGELVRPPAVEHPQEPVDSACGCRRVLVGVDSGEPTTTVLVLDQPELTVGALRRVLFASFGRARAVRPGDCDSETWVAAVTEELAKAAAAFPVGVVLERRAATLRVRRAGSLS
jgi:hypothetical protein